MQYWVTITNILAVLASLIRVGSEGFKYEQWLPLIIGRLVIKSDEKHADTIHETVLGGNLQSQSFWKISDSSGELCSETWIERVLIGKAWFISYHLREANADHWTVDCCSRQRCKLF
jgi:hypothetical protein